MELIRISDTKLKLMLSAADMARYELNCDTIDTNDPHARRRFRRIMEDVRKQSGFEAAGERIFVQLYPERDGGCEMFVTKIGLPSSREDTSSPREHIYHFPCMADLLCAARRLQGDTSIKERQAYVMEGACRHLYIRTDQSVPYMGEYNGQEVERWMQAYIHEYGRCFCTDTSMLAEFV